MSFSIVGSLGGNAGTGLKQESSLANMVVPLCIGGQYMHVRGRSIGCLTIAAEDKSAFSSPEWSVKAQHNS